MRISFPFLDASESDAGGEMPLFNEQNEEQLETNTIAAPLTGDQEPQSSPLCFDGEYGKQSEQNHDDVNTSPAVTTDEVNCDTELRCYIQKQFDCFRYRSSDKTVKYTDEQRKSVFEFVKECATNQRIRQSVCYFDLSFYEKSSIS